MHNLREMHNTKILKIQDKGNFDSQSAVLLSSHPAPRF